MTNIRACLLKVGAMALALCLMPASAFAAQEAGLAAGVIEAPPTGASEAAIATTVYTIDAEGDYVAEADIASAMAAAGVEPPLVTRNLTAAESTLSTQSADDDGIVVVLDPGHGGSDGGATGIGFMEKEANLAIAKYCKAKLEKQPGITVYMTREDDTYVSLDDRTQCAVDHDADIIVSLHNNSNGGQARGSEVIVPQEGSWYYETAYLTGQEIGAKILANLNALGLSTHAGVYSRNNTVGASYPDGTPSDYYALVRGPRANGILGIIVEHAFVNNVDDAKFLDNDASLKQIGEADAQAIIDYFDSSEAIKRLYWAIFDPDFYAAELANVERGGDAPEASASAGEGSLQLFSHFKSVGMPKGWRGNELFDATFYREANSDLEGMLGDDLASCYWHFLDYGMSEGRQPSAEFVPEYYKANYADLRAAFGDDWVGYYRHYLDYGIAEQRTADKLLEGAVPDVEAVGMNRLYNPYSGEHFYTSSGYERDQLVDVGWRFEGTGWLAPVKSETPVYRLYNSFGGEHHYTMDGAERDSLVDAGWTDEGTGWYSDDAKATPLYRQYNPNEYNCNHNYTTSKQENDELVAEGWLAEGIAWYGVEADEDAAEAAPANDEPIMGASSTTVDQMVRRYDEVGKPYPGDVYAKYGASGIQDFCQILYEEADAEGVRAEVVFAQAMHETGWLQFGGDVSADQCNFAGIGATGGVPGNSFNTYGADSVRMGLRAQVQHLKAYASTEPLNNDVVDPRFSLVTRGRGQTVQALAGKWATGSTYGDALYDQIQALLKA